MRSKARAAGIDLVRRDVAPGLSIYVPEDPDQLLEGLSEEAFRRSDERMPYFATLWPAGVSLAEAVLAAGALDGRRVLDLGCGVGVVGLAAASCGGRVTFLDWEPRSLEIVRLAADAQGLEVDGLLAADWRDPPPLDPFDLVLAADVLYEARNVPAVVRFLRAHLGPDGEAWIAEPGRDPAEGFPAEAEGAGLVLLESRALSPRADGGRHRLHRLQRGA